MIAQRALAKAYRDMVIERIEKKLMEEFKYLLNEELARTLAEVVWAEMEKELTN